MGDGPRGETRPAGGLACLNRRLVCCGKAPVRFKRMRLGRIYADPAYPPPACGVSCRARAGGCVPYRIYEKCGFAPTKRVPRFSDGVSENSAVSLVVI